MIFVPDPNLHSPGQHINVQVPVHHDGWDCHYLEVLEDLDRRQPDAKTDKVIFQVPEGVGLVEMGVLAMIEIWQQRTDFPKDRIEVNCHNTVESIPYRNFGFGACILNEGLGYSHYLPVKANAKKFGLFVGRFTLPRVCMAWHMNHYHGRDTLMSCMLEPANMRTLATKELLDKTTWHTLENLTIINWMHDLAPYTRDLVKWWDVYDIEAVRAWYKNDRPGSIDGRRWEEQYIQGRTSTNRTLVNHYDKFCVEIVAETANYGNAFWVTEKTARPIVAGKPFMIFGTKNFLARLKILGFQTFDSLWDESYDQYDGLDRWMIMRDVITRLCQLDRVAWRDLMLSAHAIALENYKHYHSIAPWTPNSPWPKDSMPD